jgi:hypothetical protein
MKLLDLFERTGVRAFAFFACRHADDPTCSHCVDSDDALDFFTQGLDMSAPHFMRKFEQWSCNLDEGRLALLGLHTADFFPGKHVKNGSAAVRKDVSRLITDRLCEAFNFAIARLNLIIIQDQPPRILKPKWTMSITTSSAVNTASN